MDIQIKRRSLFGRLCRAPKVLRAHYRILRRHANRWDAAVAAFTLTMALIEL